MRRKMVELSLIWREGYKYMNNQQSPKPIYNRPGLPGIAYRIGDYNSFRQRLLAALASELIEGETPEKSKRPLAKLTTRSPEDPAIALLDAWAIVADVLTFYQERIANEGYLRTATERFSVLELARSIGYELSPGVAASTYLAFTVDDSPGGITEALVPQDTQVMSVPSKEDELPQTFETSGEILARVEWNAIKPKLNKAQEITANIKQIYLEGTNTQLQAGDCILLIGNQEEDETKTYLLNLTTVETFSEQNYTLVSWQEEESSPVINSKLRNPQVFAFRNSASLFGKNAPKWEDMPDEIKKEKGGTITGGIFRRDNNSSNWLAKNNGLPNTDILCLASNLSSNYIFAGTIDRGIFRSQDNGETWEAVNAGITNLSIQTLYMETLRGHVFAGTPGGGIFRSKDNGNNWIPIHTGSIRVEGQNGNNWKSVNTGIPNTVVRSLLTYTTTTNLGTGTIFSQGTTILGYGTEFTKEFNVGDDITVEGESRRIVEINSDISLRVNSRFLIDSGSSFLTPNRDKNYIFAGTDNGIFRSQDAGKNWLYQGGYDGLSDRVVNDLVALEISGIIFIFAGTDNGVFSSQDNGNNWVAVNNGDLSSGTLINSLVVVQSESDNNLFAGTNRSIYLYQQQENDWITVDNSLPNDVVVYSLESYNNNLFAATNQGIFSSSDNGTSWSPVNQGLSTNNIISLAVNNSNIFAGSLFYGFQDPDWPSFAFPEPELDKNNKIDLDTIYPRILEKSWVVLLEDNLDASHFQASQVESLSTISRSDFNLESEITSITSTELDNSLNFNRRLTKVLIQSEALKLASEQLTIPVQGKNIFDAPLNQDKIFLNSFVPDLQPEKALIFSGKHIRAKVKDIGGFFSYNSQENQENQWERKNQGLTNYNISALAIKESELPQRIEYYLGTTQGVFRSLDSGKNWEPISENLTDNNIQALLVSSDGEYIFAGTPSGIFRYSRTDKNWEEKNQGLVHLNVQALVIDSEEIIFAGTTNGGIFVSRNNGDIWSPTGLTNENIQTLAINQETRDLFAGTLEKGIFYSVDQGNTWQQLTNLEKGIGTISSDGVTVQGSGTIFNQQLNVGDTINAGGQSRVIVNILNNVDEDEEQQTFTVDVPFRPDLADNTSFTIETGLTNLKITSILIIYEPGEGTIFSEGTTVRFTNANSNLREGSRITAAGQTRIIQKIISANEVQINIPFAANLNSDTEIKFAVNTIFIGTAGSGVFRSRNYGRRWEQINPNLTDLEIRTLAGNSNNNENEILVGTASKGIFHSNNNGDSWIAMNNGLTNTDVQAIAVSPTGKIIAGGNGILISPDGFYNTPLQLGDLLWVIAPPVKIEADYQWLVRDINGFVGIVTTTDNELQLQPATDDDETISEVCIIKNPPTNQENPLLTLSKPLKYAYDPETVTIYGNVVIATHGETITEVIGSGDGTVANQSFTLKKPPLTHISAPTAKGAKSTLEIRVDDVQWSEVDTLYQQDHQLQGYIIRLTNDGTPIITFGDGKDGARLPTGEDNLTATYRSGIGLEGQVDAESLTLIKQRPLGIIEATNPLPATGAASPETLLQAREKAPSKIRTLDRIVSLQDFEDFARGFPGIGKAQAIPLWNGQSQFVHITVAGVDGSLIDASSNLYQQLVTAIDNNRDPIQIVQVDSYEPLLFNLEAKFQFDSRYESDKLVENIIQALQQKFTFTKRNFGQNVTTAEVIATIQRVEGVVAVDLDALYKRGTSRGLEQSLSAALARWDEEQNQALSAQLLLLNPQNISLSATPVVSNE